MRKVCFNCSIFILSVFLSGESMANIIPKLTLKEKVSKSEYIFIGEFVGYVERKFSIPGLEYEESISKKSPQSYSLKLAIIKPILFVKNKNSKSFPEEIHIVIEGPISEWNPNCCGIGSTNLFFINKSPLYGKVNESVSAMYGVYELEKQQVLEWPDKESGTRESLPIVLNLIKNSIVNN